MKVKVAFFRCGKCGNVVDLLADGGGELACCGQPMKRLEPNTTDGAAEKHVPVVKRQDGKITVEVGSVHHPMTEQHFIEWIAVITDTRTERIFLSPGDTPRAVFCEAENAEVYEYCNLHGLWKA